MEVCPIQPPGSFLPLLRADLTPLKTDGCTADEPLDCSISALGGLEDEAVSRDNVAAWHDQTGGTFTPRTSPGDHFHLRSAQAHLPEAVSGDPAHVLGQVAGGVNL